MGASDDKEHYSFHQPNLELFGAVTAGDDFMGLTTDASAGVGVLGINNAASAPDEANDPVGGGILWCAAGALEYLGSSGTQTTLGAAEPHCPDCGNDFVLQWQNKGRKQHLLVCMWCVSKNMKQGVIKREGGINA